jgi:hypothetical protein
MRSLRDFFYFPQLRHQVLFEVFIASVGDVCHIAGAWNDVSRERGQNDFLLVSSTSQ